MSKSPLDIGNIIPGFVGPKTKLIFRVYIGFMVLWFIFLFSLYGFKDRLYLECPAGGPVCQNPLYFCSENQTGLINFNYWELDCLNKEEAPEEALTFCSEIPEACSKKLLQPGEFYGEKTPYYIKITPMLFLIAGGLAFLINHIMRGRFKNGGS